MIPSGILVLALLSGAAVPAEDPLAEATRLEAAGDVEGALALAERTLGAALLSGEDPAPALLELACRTRLALARGIEQPEARARALDEVHRWLLRARSLAPDSTELVRLGARLLADEGWKREAALELEAGLGRHPSASALHEAWIELHVEAGLTPRLGPRYEAWNAAGTNATLSWFAGRAWRLGADAARRERRFAVAREGYERALEWLGVARTLAPELRDAVEGLEFACELGQGWCELEEGPLAAARTRWLGLLARASARCDEPDGLGRTLREGLGALCAAHAARHEFEHAAEAAAGWVARLPEDARGWRELGRARVAHGRQLAAELVPGGGEERAREVQKEGWRAYLRALALAGDDPRLLNEAARVQILELRDDLGEAEALLARAREHAQAEERSAADERARFAAARVRGDAEESLGLLYAHVYRQPERARAAFQAALATETGARAVAVEHLRFLEGTGPAASEPRVPARAPGAPAPRALPAWAAPWSAARAAAALQGVPLVLALCGAAHGAEFEPLDELLRSEEFARATQGALVVLAASERETSLDRRADGRRLECPRFSRLTCGEHVEAWDAARVWFRELFGAEPGAAEEGLWWFPPGSERPERLLDLAQLPAARAVGVEAFSGPFEALEASLAGESGLSEARALVAERDLDARLLIERVLWDGFRSSPARGFVLEALAEQGDARACELFRACVRQEADPELALAALEHWPRTLALEAVRHAACWSPSQAVRLASERLLARDEPKPWTPPQIPSHSGR